MKPDVYPLYVDENGQLVRIDDLDRVVPAFDNLIVASTLNNARDLGLERGEIWVDSVAEALRYYPYL